MIFVRCAKDSVNSILIVFFFKKDVYALQWNLMYSFFSNLKKKKLFVNKPRGASPLRHFFVMFLVKGAERRGQLITGAQKDLTLRWLRIY